MSESTSPPPGPPGAPTDHTTVPDAPGQAKLVSSNESASASASLCPLCTERARQFAEDMARILPLAQRDHEAFLKGLLKSPPTSILRITPHSARRQVDRLIGASELRDLVETGEPFEWFSPTPTWRAIALVGETASGRLLHVRCQYAVTQPMNWWVQTIYDPTFGKSWWWSTDGRRRVCFCPPPPGWVEEGDS